MITFPNKEVLCFEEQADLQLQQEEEEEEEDRSCSEALE